MPKRGDVVIVDFLGATGPKRRPAVILSSDVYHRERPDMILGVITSNITAATSATDYILQDWSAANLDRPSAFRAYLGMALPSALKPIGHLSDRDWQAIRERARRALA